MTKEKAKALELLQKEYEEIGRTEAVIKREKLNLPWNASGALFDMFKSKCVLVGLVFDDIIMLDGERVYYANERSEI